MWGGGDVVEGDAHGFGFLRRSAAPEVETERGVGTDSPRGGVEGSRDGE